MKIQTKYLRKLAERHFFEQEQLEEHEIALLKNSKFSNVLSSGEGSIFFELAENALKEIEKNSLDKPKSESSPSTKSIFHETDKHIHHTNSGDLEGLTDGIKDEFDISVPPDYSHVPVDKLKDYINEYSAQHVLDPDTKFEIQNALKLNNTRSIMGALYTHLAM